MSYPWYMTNGVKDANGYGFPDGGPGLGLCHTAAAAPRRRPPPGPPWSPAHPLARCPAASHISTVTVRPQPSPPGGPLAALGLTGAGGLGN